MENKDEWEKVESLLELLVAESQENLLKMGRKIVPTLTPEDILQPNDYPELENNPFFRYEEGYLAGLLSALTAVKAQHKDQAV